MRTAQDRSQGLTVEGQDVVGHIGYSIPLKILIHQTDQVTVESVRLLGLPPGFLLADSAHTLRAESDSEILNLTGWNIADLRIEPLDRRIGRFPISLVLAWKLQSTDLIEVSVTEFTVAITAERPNGARESPRAEVQEARIPREPAAKSGADAPAPDPVAIPSPQKPAVIDARTPPMPAPDRGADGDRRAAGGPVPRPAEQAPVPRPSTTFAPRPTQPGPFVERAKGLIGRGDISGARLFLERARTRNEPNATFLLAQTWDPEMLRQWNVRGLRPDPERAQALYREAAEQKRADDRLLSATQR